MKKRKFRIAALLMAAVILVSCLSGCAVTERLNAYIGTNVPVVKFKNMSYVRPDTAALLEYQAECVELARAGEDFKALEDKIWALYDEYYNFATQQSLADIYYSQDLTDLYWEEEYNWCMEATAEVDAAMDQLFFVLAASGFRQQLEREDLFGAGFFDAYMGESVWDAEFTAMMEEEAVLVNQYYDLYEKLIGYEYGSAGYDAVAMDMAELYAELVLLRQRQADHSGYNDFRNFAYEFYYDRDYTPSQEELYLSQVRVHLVPLYRRICTAGVDGMEYEEVSKAQTYNYVREAARNMGGMIWESFLRMDVAGLYDISYGENKYGASFEIFLMNYYEPFIFMNPMGDSYDKLTFAHEFGHFCNDYVSYGSLVGVDAGEVFSQGMEYLSLEYTADTEALTKLKMLDSLCIYVEQSAYATFEAEVYRMDPKDVTAENIIALYEDVAARYAMDLWDVDGLEFVTIFHFFTNPLYVFSYVVSNDAAMQIYQMERTETGAGLALYEENLDADTPGFLGFLEEAGLKSPFSYGRVIEAKLTFHEILG